MKSRLKQRSTARGLFLSAALLSFALSVLLYFAGDETEGIFVAIWVPSILALGAFIAPRREPARRARGGGTAMTLVIFIYGTVVFGIVSLALSLIAWGIVNERRDRIRFEQGREVFGEVTRFDDASDEHGAPAR